MAKLVSKQYAKAIFELAVEKNSVDNYYDQADFLHSSLKDNEQLQKTILHPQITSADKLQLLESIFKQSVCDDFFGLFEVLLRKNREEEILNVLEDFLGSVQEYRGSAVATVQSAIPLSENQIQRITGSLEKALGKKVEIVSQVLPQLIGGLRISCAGHILDASVKKQFDDMKKLLKEC